MFIFFLLEQATRLIGLALLPFFYRYIVHPTVLSPLIKRLLILLEHPPIAWTVALALFYKLVLFPTFISSLSKLPQPHWSCSVSPVWHLWNRFHGRENRILEQLHREYGPTVRIGPSEVSVNSLEAVKTVYQGGFDKHTWYDVFNNYGVPNTFSATRSKHHSTHKRIVSNVYSKSYISSSAAASAQAHTILTKRLLPLLDNSIHHKQQPHGINVHSLFCAVAMDFITAYCFGISRSSNFIQDKNYREHWLKLYMTRKGHGFWEQELPSVAAALKYIRMSLTPFWVGTSNLEMQKWCKNKSDAAVNCVRSKGVASLNHISDNPVVVAAILAGIERENTTHGKESPIHATAILNPELSIASEVFDHILAGQETTGVTLTYLSWHLSQSLELQYQLQTELRNAVPDFVATTVSGNNFDGIKIPDDKTLDTLPILHAVITETIRRYAPAGGPEARVVPKPSCFIAGHEIPGGTRISASPYNVHRDEKAYPHPLRWDHTRWLGSKDGNGGNDDRKETSNRHFWGFSSGGRMCLGSNFAMHELKLTVAAIWANYTTHVVDDHGIEQTDAYTGHPKSNSLYLRFERVG